MLQLCPAAKLAPQLLVWGEVTVSGKTIAQLLGI
jgi:hypothetical protein